MTAHRTVERGILIGAKRLVLLDLRRGTPRNELDGEGKDEVMGWKAREEEAIMVAIGGIVPVD